MEDTRQETPALNRFTRDLTADAHAGRLEVVRCRDEEIARTIDILLRQGKNNPALVGQAGVGKTAIAEGLAMRIAEGKVPIALRNLRLLSLDAVGLLAGTTYRGQYEERLRALVAETSAAGDVLLFVDEMHNLIGQGSATGSAMDAANMLKPALARGEFRLLGATTDEEYERWILGDPALERRFQKIAVRELSPAETLEILRTRIPSLARHHNVVITDAAVRASIELTICGCPTVAAPTRRLTRSTKPVHTRRPRRRTRRRQRRSSLAGANGSAKRNAQRRRHARRPTMMTASRSTAWRAAGSPRWSDSARRSKRRSCGRRTLSNRSPAPSRQPRDPTGREWMWSSNASSSRMVSLCADTTSRASSD